jgi:hypothetical protein
MNDCVSMLTNGLRGLLAVAVLAATPVVAAAQDRVLGLLSLPDVFGNGPCQAFEPNAIAVHAEPGSSTATASIQVDQHWSFAPHGGCEGLKVSVHRNGERDELPTLEYANESPAAVVLAAQDGWFKIRLSGGSGWLRALPYRRFMPLADLFSEYVTLTSLTDAFSAPLLDAPGGRPIVVKSTLASGFPVRVVEVRNVGEQLWLHIALMSHSICDAEHGGPPEVEGLGWVPAHASTGEPTVWFSSRGC